MFFAKTESRFLAALRLKVKSYTLSTYTLPRNNFLRNSKE